MKFLKCVGVVSAVVVAGSIEAQTSGPSWRTETPQKPEALEVPTDDERPVMEFSVDRSAFSPEPMNAPQSDSKIEVLTPELGRSATLFERLGNFNETEVEEVTTEEMAPQAQDEPVALEPVDDRLAIVETPSVTVELQPAAPNPKAGVSESSPEEPRVSDDPWSEPAVGALRVVQTIDPEYPRDALIDGTEGWVDVDVFVKPDGSVAHVDVVNAKPRRVFDSATVRAVNQWRFERPESVNSTRVRIEFNLGDQSG